MPLGGHLVGVFKARALTLAHRSKITEGTVLL